MQIKEPKKKDTLELLFSNSLSDGRFHNQFSDISSSDSFFFISHATGESELYLRGKLFLKKNILDYNEYDSIAKKYHLKEMDILKFARPGLNYQFKENSACTKLKSLNSEIRCHSVMKSKSGTIFQYLVTENEIPKLKICNLNRSFIFHIKNEEFGIITYEGEVPTYTKSLGEIRSHIKLIDITGDGKEELFIFYDMTSSPAISFSVYQINYLE